MQFRDYWSVIAKRWWLILLVAFVATAATIGFSSAQEKVYQSSIKLTVTPSRLDYGLTLVIENLLRQYSQRLQTNTLAEKVNERLQLDLSVDKLREKVKVSPVSEDYLILVTVNDGDPNRARDIAFAWADEFVKEQQVLMAPVSPTDRIEVAILDRPSPGDLFYPKTRQFAVAAAALGAVVGLLLAFLLEYLDDTLKSTEDVERYTKLAVLGAIPSAGSSSAAGVNGRLSREKTPVAGRGG